MTNKEFAFNYAGKEFMFYGDRVTVVGYDNEYPEVAIVSPEEVHTNGSFWGREFLDPSDFITYKTERTAYQYAQIKELEPITEEKPQAVAKVKPMTPGECIAYYEGQQGMKHSVINGCVSAVYKRQGDALKLVSWGDGINNINEKVWGKKSQ